MLELILCKESGPTTVNSLTPQQYCQQYLSDSWSEKDLQMLIQQRLRQQTFGLLSCLDEVNIKSATTTRRSDLETWSHRYEVKRFLTYDTIFHAVAQLYLYGHYGKKILGFIPKRKVVMGVAPFDPYEYQIAAKLAEDFRGLGITVVFLNEEPQWTCKRQHQGLYISWKVLLLLVPFVCGLAMYLLLSFIK